MTGISTQGTDSSTGHNNLQPYAVAQHIVKSSSRQNFD
jgi:hypothetical protein